MNDTTLFTQVGREGGREGGKEGGGKEGGRDMRGSRLEKRPGWVLLFILKPLEIWQKAINQWGLSPSYPPPLPLSSPPPYFFPFLTHTVGRGNLFLRPSDGGPVSGQRWD